MSSAGMPDNPPEVSYASPPVEDMTISSRSSFAISHIAPGSVLQSGDHGFQHQVARFYTKEEGEAAEACMRLKAKLRTIKNDDVWNVATHGIASICGAQYAFISKRQDTDYEDPSRSLPEFGAPGSCLLGMSIYFNNGKGFEHNSSNAQYIAYGSPCEHMKHDKVVLIPENLSQIAPDNPNELPEQPEGYLGLPLSYYSAASDKEIYFGHFGVMWTADGLASRKLNFPFLESLLHNIEELLVTRFQDFGYLDDFENHSSSSVLGAHSPPQQESPVFHRPAMNRSLKSYASSLSHELRTPMQGVVGMLDIMYATVQEAAESTKDKRMRNTFRGLRENIELVQDSARRAVEAADNVVHAYDMDMSVPDAPPKPNENDELPTTAQIRPGRLQIAPSDSLSPGKSHKRQRSSLDGGGLDKPHKMPRRSYQSSADLTPVRDARRLDSTATQSSNPNAESTPSSVHGMDGIVPGIRQTFISDTIQNVINDALKTGGRPDSAIGHPIDGGEEIEVRQKGPNGSERVKLVRWSIDPSVPESIFVDERDFAGLLFRVLHNAFKFTETGSITTNVRLSPKGKYILINIKDTGCGIPMKFFPKLFKAFSKEDDSINRHSEGLGLGLMVALGFARRLNGDLYAVRSETSGPDRGTEFEMRIPIVPGEIVSRPGTPYGSRSPSSASRSVDPEHPHSPRQFPKSLAVQHTRTSSLLSQSTMTTSEMITVSEPTAPSYSQHFIPNILTPATTASNPCSALPTPQLPAMLNLIPCSTMSDRPRRTSPLAPPPPRKLASTLPLSFLIVEDNNILRTVLVQMLKNMGYTNIRQAYDGLDAVRQMEMHHNSFMSGDVDYEIDVILMDVWMPGMNGYQAARHILGHAAGSEMRDGQPGGWKIPIIITVTADVTDEAMDHVAKSGMKGPLTKPYKQIDLQRTIMQYCALPSPPMLANV